MAGYAVPAEIATVVPTLLTNVPEKFGAERILMIRCHGEATFRKTVAMINDLKHDVINHQQLIDKESVTGK